jgi:hypothetical protein
MSGSTRAARPCGDPCGDASYDGQDDDDREEGCPVLEQVEY